LLDSSNEESAEDHEGRNDESANAQQVRTLNARRLKSGKEIPQYLIYEYWAL
jgi:hypothetical protein